MDKRAPEITLHVTLRQLPDGRIEARCGAFTATCSTEERAQEMVLHLAKTNGRGRTPASAVLRLTQH